MCKNGYLIQKWLFTELGCNKWPHGPFSRSFPRMTCRLLFPTWLLNSSDDTSYYLQEWLWAFWKNTNRADPVSISSIFLHSPFLHLPLFSFIYLLPPSFSFIHLSLFDFVNLHSPLFIFIHLYTNSFNFIYLHSHSFWVIDFLFISLHRPSGFTFIHLH